MANMKTLTVDGETYTVKDGGAVRFDETQTLTADQKTQARQNIGAGDMNAGQNCMHLKSVTVQPNITTTCTITGFSMVCMVITYLTDSSYTGHTITIPVLMLTANTAFPYALQDGNSVKLYKNSAGSGLCLTNTTGSTIHASIYGIK